MKKLYTTFRFKARNKIRSRKALRRRLKFKGGKKSRNRVLEYKPAFLREPILNRHKFFDYVKLSVPTNFSFLSNPEGVSRFIYELKKNFNKRRKVFILMKKVQSIDHSAIVILLSIMVRFKSQKIKFNGDFPSNSQIANTFIGSGFFDILNKDHLKNTDRYKLGKHKIYTHAWKNVDAELSERIMIDVANVIHNQKVIFKGIHRTLVELMQNSYNHATPSKEGEKHWWLSVNVDEKQRIASFSFIDYGVGIFESLNNKEETSKWYNWKDLLKNLFSFDNNSDILRLILDGELHKTVTGEYFRGKGLPGIKEAMDRQLITKLHIISNDVYANVSDKILKKLSHNFEGTFVYWEVNDQTIYVPWIQ